MNTIDGKDVPGRPMLESAPPELAMNGPVQIYEAGALACGVQACPAGIARQETSSFTNGSPQCHDFPNKLKEGMDRTTEVNTPRPMSSGRETESRRTTKLIPQLKSGLQTFGGLNSASCVWSSSVFLSTLTNLSNAYLSMKGVICYAIR